MSVSTGTPDNHDTSTPPKQRLSTHWTIILLSALILFSAVLFVNYRQPHTTYAVAPATPEIIVSAGTPVVSSSRVKAPNIDKLAMTPSIWPVNGSVTSGFGWRTSPFGDGNEMHPGLDIAGTMGLPVVATADGMVVHSGWAGDYGNMVQIDHGNGIATIYGHNSQLAVSVGQSVKKGQIISFVGSTGKSTGPHLHYEVRENGTAVDPLKYLTHPR